MEHHITLNNIRKSILTMKYKSQSSHIGSCYSIVEILYTLFEKKIRKSENHIDTFYDKLVLSKAHASAALYATLAEFNYIKQELLDEFYIDGGSLPGHLDRTKLSCLETSGGSLGHGLSVGIGMAIANPSAYVYVILGDGECNEGSVWEAVMLAAQLKIKNLIAIVDCNRLQGLGVTAKVIDQSNLAEQWKSFGWDCVEIDGHNLDLLNQEIAQSFKKIPKVVLCQTIKGKGVSFMEDSLQWHYKSPNEEQYLRALEEMGE